MAAITAPDGSLRITVVDGLTRTGLHAADGSLNVVNAPGTIVGAMHPCGAWWVKKVTGPSIVNRRAATGALNVVTTPYTATGAQKVTVISGVLT
jgi:hypothetical protein